MPVPPGISDRIEPDTTIVLTGGDPVIGAEQCAPSDKSKQRDRKSLALTLEEYRTLHPVRGIAMAKAYLSGAYTMAEIGKFFSIPYMTVSRSVRKIE